VEEAPGRILIATSLQRDNFRPHWVVESDTLQFQPARCDEEKYRHCADIPPDGVPDSIAGRAEAADDTTNGKSSSANPSIRDQIVQFAMARALWTYEAAADEFFMENEALLPAVSYSKGKEKISFAVNAKLDLERNKYHRMSFRQKLEYLSSVNPDFGDRYEPLHISGRKLYNILEYQVGNVVDFVNLIMNWADRKISKKNTLVFVGPPDSFKTWIASGLCSVLGKVGKVEPYKKGCQFAFSSLTKCNVGLFEEAIFPLQAPEYTETMKSVMEGNDLEVNVKYTNHTPTKFVPILMTSNKIPWASVEPEPYVARSHVFTFKHVPEELRNPTSPGGKCHPLAWKYVLDVVENKRVL